ncbi:hypothetical protein H1P_670004 [Hyella patelloides LEGE 07179]|uniref:Uncharacterized protein n=1 Tax=Hyella patelloides LEGE 07179 TaxID=945734 RepID=A0A563W2Q6_9CYAN|nr:hypothetical protein H1P_670004 [Hyella patelloides LEGE 07179]
MGCSRYVLTSRLRVQAEGFWARVYLTNLKRIIILLSCKLVFNKV